MLHSTIHIPSTKIGIGRGLELLPQDWCLREERASGATGYSKWKAQLPVAFVKKRRRNIETGNGLLGLLLTPPVPPSFDAWPSSQLR
jgi:hypothetical protein